MRRRSLVAVLFVLVLTGGGVAAVVSTNTSPKLGLDLQGGLSVVLAAKGNTSSDRLDKALDIIRSRVDALGVGEPEIARAGDTIVVDLPGVRNQDRARQIIGRTAVLQFRPVLASFPLGRQPRSTTTTAPGGTTTPSTGAPQGGGSSTTAKGRPDVAGQANAACPGESGDFHDPNATISICDKDRRTLYELGPVEVSGKAVKTARAEIPQGQWEVTVDFTSQGSAEWDAMAAKYVGKQVAIVLDGIVQSAPVIQTARFGGRAQITGRFSQSEAKDLALVLRYGALPVELREISVEQVSATLGRDQLNSGLVAGLVGLAVVFLYMLAYYRLLGLVVWTAVFITAGALYAVVSWLGNTISLTLTLAGVVGLIVSIGVIVDSNIVYFERLKEEVRAGRTPRSAVDRGFSKAFRTIVAADIVTLLAAVLLWILAIGSVKGFAFYLGLATVLDLFVSYFFMHPLVVLLARSRRFGLGRFGVAGVLSAGAAPEASAP